MSIGSSYCSVSVPQKINNSHEQRHQKSPLHLQQHGDDDEGKECQGDGGYRYWDKVIPASAAGGDGVMLTIRRQCSANGNDVDSSALGGDHPVHCISASSSVQGESAPSFSFIGSVRKGAGLLANKLESGIRRLRSSERHQCDHAHMTRSPPPLNRQEMTPSEVVCAGASSAFGSCVHHRGHHLPSVGEWNEWDENIQKTSAKKDDDCFKNEKGVDGRGTTRMNEQEFSLTAHLGDGHAPELKDDTYDPMSRGACGKNHLGAKFCHANSTGTIHMIRKSVDQIHCNSLKGVNRGCSSYNGKGCGRKSQWHHYSVMIFRLWNHLKRPLLYAFLLLTALALGMISAFYGIENFTKYQSPSVLVRSQVLPLLSGTWVHSMIHGQRSLVNNRPGRDDFYDKLYYPVQPSEVSDSTSSIGSFWRGKDDGQERLNGFKGGKTGRTLLEEAVDVYKNPSRSPSGTEGRGFGALDLTTMVKKNRKELMGMITRNLFIPAEMAKTQYHIHLNYLTPSYLVNGQVKGNSGASGYAFWKEHMAAAKKDVTLVTQVPSSNFVHVSIIMKLWKGPMSVAVFVEDISELEQQIHMLQCFEDVRKYLNIHLVFQNTEQYKSYLTLLPKKTVRINCDHKESFKFSSAVREMSEHRFAINTLRNVALGEVKTDFVFPLNGDVLPSPRLRELFLEYAKRENLFELYENDFMTPRMYDRMGVVPLNLPVSRSDMSNKDAKKKRAYVVPAFETVTLNPTTNSIPRNKMTLGQHIRLGYVRHYESEIWFRRQARVNYKKWEGLSPVADLANSSIPIPTYKINPAGDEEFLAEPFYIYGKDGPLFDERFLKPAFDRRSHCYLLQRLGYEFSVLPDEFVIGLGWKNMEVNSNIARAFFSNLLLWQEFQEEF
eukprot:Nk52_evm26s2391 gene=Nk52_evmTU26s2391